MNTIARRRAASVLALLAILAVLATACSPRTPSGSSNGDREVVPAPIDGLEILIRESFPPGYTLKITSGLPSGCAKFHGARIAGRSGDEITVTVTNTIPTDDNIACTAIYGMHETNLDLGQDFVSGRTYTVKVNDKQTTFRAQ